MAPRLHFPINPCDAQLPVIWTVSFQGVQNLTPPSRSMFFSRGSLRPFSVASRELSRPEPTARPRRNRNTSDKGVGLTPRINFGCSEDISSQGDKARLVTYSGIYFATTFYLNDANNPLLSLILSRFPHSVRSSFHFHYGKRNRCKRLACFS